MSLCARTLTLNLLFLLLSWPSQSSASDKLEALSLKAIFKPPTLLGHRPGSHKISFDGNHFSYLWSEQKSEKKEHDLWLGTTDGKILKKVFAHEEKAQIWWLNEGSHLLLLRDKWLELTSAKDLLNNVPPKPIFELTSSLKNLKFPKDPFQIVFQDGERGHLWSLNLKTGTRDTLDRELKSHPSWVHYIPHLNKIATFTVPKDKSSSQPKQLCLIDVENKEPPQFSSLRESNNRLYLSPNAKWALLTERSITHQHGLIMADYLSEKVKAVPVRNSLAGDRAPVRSIQIWKDDKEDLIDLRLDGKLRYDLHRIQFSPTGVRVLFERLSEDRKVRQICWLDHDSLKINVLFTEKNPKWIGGPFLWSSWADDDEILFTSEIDGFNHIYLQDVKETEPQQLTQGQFEIQRIDFNRHINQLLIQSNEIDPSQKSFSILHLEDLERTKLNSLKGCASKAVWNKYGTQLVYLQEQLGVPGELYSLMISRRDAEKSIRLTRTIPDSYQALHLTPPEMIEYQNPDDQKRVRAHLYRPKDFDPKKKYPMVVFIHGAGYLQNVTQSMTYYDVNMLFHHRLTEQGFVVLDPDYRHSAGYGRDFRTDIHGFMGGKDLDDVVAGVEHLVKQGFVDKDRVGIYGGSYGGFLTLMALFTKPDSFACGAALRSVTDWRTYNAWYTNPRLGSPEKDKENYVRSSPIDHADKLRRPLLLLHGLLDDNVFAQDTIRLVEKLIQGGKDFDLMLYPSQKHGFKDPESWIDEYRRIEEMMVEHLR